MRALRERIERVAVADFTVLIDGESGTGKELVARQIHDLSPRRSGPFVAVNCAALVETLLEAELFGIEERTATGVRGRRGKFEHADGGTLFLDEVADLSLAAQAKLLRAIQELAVERVGGHGTRRLNVRIVAATNTSLAALVQRGLFRADLYYRLSGLDLRVPPLRHRREDILELAQYFLACHDDRVRMALVGDRGRRPGRLRLAGQRAGAAADARGRGGDGRLPRDRSRRPAAGAAHGPTPTSSCPRSKPTTRCACGPAATRGWCSSARVTTSGGPAARWASATTRCRRTCATGPTARPRPVHDDVA